MCISRRIAPFPVDYCRFRSHGSWFTGIASLMNHTRLMLLMLLHKEASFGGLTYASQTVRSRVV
jgi:hypothetical protein